MDSKKTKTLLVDILFDFMAGIIFGTCVNFFTAPNHIAPGGITGVATLINYVFHVPIGTMSFLLNVPLMIVAFKFLGTRFSFRTMKSMTIISLMVDVVGWAFASAGITGYSGDVILAGLMGGVMTGFSLALVFLRGSTTGGLDIVSRLLKKKFPHISIGHLLFAADFCVLTLSVIVYGNIESGLYGLVTIFASSRMLDTVLYGGDKGKSVTIVSARSTEIAKAIQDNLRRGVTLLHGEGAYSAQQQKIILCAVRDNQYPMLKRVVHDIDPQAFIIVNEATEILGYGFRAIESEK